jgi:Rha family phage regulatory protein
MENLVMIDSGRTFVNSNDVAEKFEKQHRQILDNIRSVIKNEPEFGDANFRATTYTTAQNKTHECFEMSRDGFSMIAMGLTGKKAMSWKAKYITAFNKMESALIDIAPTLESVNHIVKKAESDKQIASECGSQLARYKKVKKNNQEKLDSAIKSVQISLGFKQ